MAERVKAGPAGSPGVPEPAPAIEPPATPDRRGVVELVIGFALALGGMIAFALVAGDLYNQEAVALDQWAGPFLHSISSPALDVLMNEITSLGSELVLAPLAILSIGYVLARRHRARALFLATVIGGSVALNGLLKVTVQRPRPMLPWAHVLPDYSFPSGHTMNSLALYGAFALLVWATRGRRAGALAVLLALGVTLAIAFSRIYLGYHYLSDVAGGLAAGLAWLLVVALAFEAIPRTPVWRRRMSSRTRRAA